MMFFKTCPTCKTEFDSTSKSKIYCTSNCWPSYIKIKTAHSLFRNPIIKPGNLGALSELIVCADLLEKGYNVFRSVSPNCSYDLIAHNGTGFLRIEVTTGRKRNDGKITYNSHNSDNYDILAVSMINTHEILYYPEIKDFTK